MRSRRFGLTMGEREVTVEMCESEAFLWLKVHTVIQAADGSVIYSMKAVDSGRRTSRP